MRNLLFVFAALALAGGCASPPKPAESTSHAHGHDHAHAAGHQHEAPKPGERPSEVFRKEHVDILHHIEETEKRAASLLTTSDGDTSAIIAAIVGFFQNELMPHAQAEEAVLYAVADRIIPTKAPYRYTDSLRYEHTEVHAAVEKMAKLAKSAERSPEAVSSFAQLAIGTLGLVRGHFGAEENVILAAMDRLMTPEEFHREVVEPTMAYVREHGGSEHPHH